MEFANEFLLWLRQFGLALLPVVASVVASALAYYGKTWFETEKLKAKAEWERVKKELPLGVPEMMEAAVRASVQAAEQSGLIDELIETGMEKKALALDDSLSHAHGLLGWLYTLQRQHDKGITECEEAVRLAPNAAGVHFHLSLALKYAGGRKNPLPCAKRRCV